MPLTIRGPRNAMVLEPEDLCQDAFSAFGTVIENPAPSLTPRPDIKTLPPDAVPANQGSALKYLDVTKMKNFYDLAPSKEPARAVMNMFVCGPRLLLPSRESNIEGSFPVEILERHPFTTQTFIPLGLASSEVSEARYLVIVAPTLSPSSADKKLPVPGTKGLPGRGLPDLTKIKAFIAKGSQAVTYGAGTWHAPMVVVGVKHIDFVVVQFANGIAVEDCQEVDWKVEKGEKITVAVPKVEKDGPRLWKL